MKPRRTAFTMVEFMMAATITAIIGLSVAGVSMALSSAYANSQDYYESVQTARSSVLRMQQTIRCAKLVTTWGNGGLAVWAQDADLDGQIDTSEVTVWQYDSTKKELQEGRVEYSTDALRQAMDAHESLASLTTLSGAVAVVNRSAYKQWRPLASNVQSFSVVGDLNNPKARLVTLQMTIGTGPGAMTLRSGVSLRADSTDRVQLSGNQYVLAAP